MKPPSVVFLLIAMAGCATSPVPDVVTPPLPEVVTLDVAVDRSGEMPHLNVSIEVFATVASSDSSVYSSASQVRSFERRYLPHVLKQTLDRSGYWGAVRVLPRSDPSAELLITGRLLSSDGVELRLELNVADASGTVWIDEIYHDIAGDIDYATDPDYLIDPFQDLFNRIANDMSEALKSLSDSQRGRILDTAMLRYGNVLSPESFSGYLSKTGTGQLEVVGLPAREDPIFEKVQRIRESEYLFADSVDAHYESLYRQIGQTYAWWRHYSYELIVGNERLEEIDATRGATRGSWYAMERVYKTYKESKMNEDALRELTRSFDKETHPTVTRIAGRLVRLNGTLDSQYREWREILRDIYRNEAGF